MALLSIVTRHYNTVVLLGFGLLFTFGYDMAVSAYVPSPRPAHHTPLHNALVRHPNRCMGGGLLALGLVNVLHLAPVPGALVAGAVLSAVSLHADWELFTFMATTTHPTSEYAPMLWFNVGADLVGTLLCLLGLVGLPFAFPRFYNAMLLAVVSFLMALSPLMFGGSIAAATSAPTAAWLAIAWAQYSATALGVSLLFAKPSAWQLVLTASYTMHFANHVRAAVLIASATMPLMPLRMALGNAAFTGVGLALNAATLIFHRAPNKKRS